MRSNVRVSSSRRILCVNARVPDTNEMRRAYDLVPQIKAYMVPQGILTVAAYLPPRWEVRVVDENVRPASDEELDWADAVLATGMHVQRESLADLAARAHERGKLAVAGGPSVSACPEYHPSFDILHVGELGDATEEVIASIDRSVRRPDSQLVFKTEKRLPIEDFPIPAYDQIDFMQYYLSSIQWSSGCPFRCEFCDIPALYGRVPRFKSPERLIAELDVIVARNPVGGIYFVDDNFIGNKKAVRQLLPRLIEWQRKNGYRARFGAECTVNLAMDRELMAMMRAAHFTDIFFGIESPDEDTLHAIDKDQNIQIPLLDAVKIINSHGIELSAGIILGFDTDGPDAADKVIRFVEESNIPFALANILSVLPKTPLWERLEKEGRITGERLHGMNMVYKLPRENLIAQWRKMTGYLYSPETLYRRFQHQIEHTHPNRLQLSLRRYPISWRLLKTCVQTVAAVMVELGLESSYRREFWKMAVPMLRKGDLNQLLYWATMGRYVLGVGEDARSGALTHTWFDGPRWAAADPRTGRAPPNPLEPVRLRTPPAAPGPPPSSPGAAAHVSPSSGLH
jgi:radical SAM superfamily enzyme YgiQ (UPF0313 family)